MFKFLVYLGLLLTIQVLHCQAKLIIKNVKLGLERTSIDCSELIEGPVVFYRIFKNSSVEIDSDQSKEFEVKHLTLNCHLSRNNSKIGTFQLNIGKQNLTNKKTEFSLLTKSLECTGLNETHFQRDYKSSPLMRYNSFDLEPFNEFDLGHDEFSILKSKSNASLVLSCEFDNSTLNEKFDPESSKIDPLARDFQAEKIRHHVNAASLWENFIPRLNKCEFEANKVISGKIVDNNPKIYGPLYPDVLYEVDSSVLSFKNLKDHIGTYVSDFYCESLGYSEHYKLNITVNATIEGDNSTRLVTAGSFKELSCSILSGNYIDAEWKWLKDEVEIRNSSSYLITVGKHESRLKIVDATVDHSGNYTCRYTNRFSSDEIGIQVEIKGIIGALWPFIASSVFAVVCTILIIVVERKTRTKSNSNE